VLRKEVDDVTVPKAVVRVEARDRNRAFEHDLVGTEGSNVQVDAAAATHDLDFAAERNGLDRSVSSAHWLVLGPGAEGGRPCERERAQEEGVGSMKCCGHAKSPFALGR